MSDHDPAVVARQLLMGFRGTHLLYVAAELGVADVLQDGPVAVDEIAARLGAHRDPLHRVLRALAQLGVLAEGSDGRFSLTPVGDCLRTDRPGSLRPLARFWGHEMMQRAWGWQGTRGSTRVLAELAPEAGDGAAVSEKLGECRRHGVLVDDRFAAGDLPLEKEAWRGIELPAAAPADQDWTGRQDMGDTPALGGERRDGALVGGNDPVLICHRAILRHAWVSGSPTTSPGRAERPNPSIRRRATEKAPGARMSTRVRAALSDRKGAPETSQRRQHPRTNQPPYVQSLYSRE